MEHTHRTTARTRLERCPCLRAGLELAERFNLAVAVIDIQANILQSSPAAEEMLETHPALLSSTRRVGLLSNTQSQTFRVAIRRVLSAGGEHMIRADDGCISAPLALHLSAWQCASHCLISFHSFKAQPAGFCLLAEVFDLTPRQLDLLEHFSRGLSLAEIAERTRLKPQTVREAFSNIYSKFDVQGQLELMSVLASIGSLGSPQ